MKKLLPLTIILALALSACGDFAPEATAEPSAAPEYSFTEETYPALAASAAAEELADAVTAIMLGTDRETAAERVISCTSAEAWDSLGSGACAIVIAAGAGDIPDGVGVLYVASMEYVIFSAPSISEHRKSKSESVSLLMPPDSWICLTI